MADVYYPGQVPAEYDAQFALRIGRYMEKLDRMESLFHEEKYIPQPLWDELSRIRSGLNALKQKYGKDVILPEDLI